MLKFNYEDGVVISPNKYKYLICLDEVGRGPLLGPVYTAAVVLNNRYTGSFSTEFSLVKDSKKYSSKKKLKIINDFLWKQTEYIGTPADVEKRCIIAIAVESVDETTIDKINILQSVFQGMHKCIHAVIPKIKKDMETRGETMDITKDILIMVDGNLFKPFCVFVEKDQNVCQIPHITIEKGDGIYFGIAAASIVAKNAHDEYIYSLCEKYPKLNEKYNLCKNVGYGTREHLEGIRKWGITQFHRKTFGICKTSVVFPVVDNYI